MAVTFEGVSALVTIGNGTSVTPVIPAEQAGDLGWIKMFSRVNTDTHTINSGDASWTLAHEDTTSTTIHVSYWYRWLTGSDADPLCTSNAGGTVLVAATVKIFRGAVGSGSPLDVAVPTNNEGSGTSPTAPEATSVTDGCLIVREYAGNNAAAADGGASAFTESSLGTPTAIETGDSYATETGSDGTFGSSYILQTSAGLTGTGGCTVGTSQTWRGDSFAIKPAAAGGALLAVPTIIQNYVNMGIM